MQSLPFTVDQNVFSISAALRHPMPISREQNLQKPELLLPVALVWSAANAGLVQTEDYVAEDNVFDADYAYFSSTSRSWLAHAKAYCENVIQTGLDWAVTVSSSRWRRMTAIF
jgi:hypothetical protein